MSFLEEVSSIGQFDLNNLDTDLNQIASKVSKCRQCVESDFGEYYVQYTSFADDKVYMLDKVKELRQDLTSLKNRLEQLNVTDTNRPISKLSSLSEHLDTSTVEFNVLDKVITVHNTFLELQDLQEEDSNDSLFKQAKVVARLNALLCDSVFKLEPFKSLHTSITNDIISLDVEFDSIWDRNLILDVKESSCDTYSTALIKIRREYNFAALFEAHQSISPEAKKVFKRLGMFVVEELCEPIFINSRTSVNIEDNNEEFLCLSMLRAKSKSNMIVETLALCRSILEKLSEIFGFFRNNFNYESAGVNNPLSLLGREIGKAVSNKLSDCLQKLFDHIIKSKEENKYDQFKDIIERVHMLEQELDAVGVTASDSLRKYVDKLESVLIETKCTGYLERSVLIMKRDLHDNMEFLGAENTDPLRSLAPQRCFISKSAFEIVKLTENLIEQGIGEADVYVSSLLKTTFGIFNQYCDVSYTHHKKLIRTIPQQVALFRNNCFYVAHQLQLMDAKYTKAKFQHFAYTTLFTETANSMCKFGERIFNEFVERQIAQNETTLLQYGFVSTRLSTASLEADFDKCIRQCVRQYELLKTVWYKVLPAKLYSVTIGNMLDRFCVQLIGTVTSAVDISCKNCELMVEMFRIVLARGPKLFDDQSEAIVKVASWQKFEELIFVLDARLMDIGARWAEGKGPLALHFTVVEMRGLIKALFQDSVDRAAVLSKIKND